MSLIEKIRLLEVVVKTPVYSVAGCTFGKLVYVSTVEGASDLWSLDLERKEKVRLTTGGVHSVAEPSDKSPMVIYTKDVRTGRELHQVFAVDCRGGEEKLLADLPPMRIIGLAFDGERVAFTGITQTDIAIYLAKLDGSCEKLYSVNTIAFVSDVNEKYVVGAGTLRGDPKSKELFIYNLETGEFTVYTPKEGCVNNYPKLRGEKILFETNAFGGNKLVVYDIESGSLSDVSFSYRDYSDHNPVEHSMYGWTDEGKVWAVGKKNGRSRLFVDGKLIPLPEGYVTSCVVKQDKVYATVSSLVKPPEVYTVGLKEVKVETLIENKLPPEVSEKLGEVKFVKYKSFDGLEIPAFVIESNAAEKPGPTVVFVHGGPWSEVADSWRSMIAALVVCGYHVVAPNFRGSTGYGEEFRLLDIGDPGGGDLQDVVYARNWAIETGLASKVAIMGYSYGGYMTFLATAKHPDLWACGVAGAGIVDWEELYELSDAIFRKFVEVLFAGRKDLWKERSPKTYVENVKAPLCIIHPQNDTRTPLRPVLKYISKLLEMGRTFEVHILPDAGHAITKVEDALKILLPAVIFLEKYMK